MKKPKVRILVTGPQRALLHKFQGVVPAHYEVFPCSAWTEVEDAILAYSPHLVVEIHNQEHCCPEASVKFPEIPFLRLEEADLEGRPDEIDALLSQPACRLGDLSSEMPLLGNSLALRNALAQMRKLARSRASILLTGENGTGKELAAKAIHQWSPWRDGPFIAVNCAAIPAALAEAELFGNVKGAFTDAVDRKGCISQASGGTLFLDEVGDLPREQQAKLLRILETKDFHRIGSSTTEAGNFRLLCATNLNLAEAVKNGAMRLDFYHRIRVAEVRLPPLRERLEDLPLLVSHFLCQLDPSKTLSITPGAMQKLQTHPWPGNVRELRNCLERAILLRDSDRLEAKDFDLAQE